MGIANAIGHLFVGGVVLVYGIGLILRRKGDVGIGGGRMGGMPLIRTEISGTAAVFLGVCLVIGGSLTAFSFVFEWLADTFSAEFFYRLPGIGVMIIVVGIMVSGIINSFLDR
jgi:hypothetical protein